MAKRAENQTDIRVYTINKSEHRARYLKELEIMTKINAYEISSFYVFKFCCFLENWGVYRDYDFFKYINWFKKYEDTLYSSLDSFFINNQKAKNYFTKLFSDIYRICTTSANSFSNFYYYDEFLSDLKVMLKLEVGGQYYNFITPSWRNNTEKCIAEIALFKYQHETQNNIDLFKADYYKTINTNRKVNKNVVGAIKERIQA